MEFVRLIVFVGFLHKSDQYSSDYYCPTGWSLYEQGQALRCYFANDLGLKSFEDARRFCDGLDATMISIGSEEEALHVNNIVQDTFWLGLRRTTVDSIFTRDNPIAANFSRTYSSGGYLQYPRFGWIWLDGTLYNWHFNFELEADYMGFQRWDINEPKGDPNIRCAINKDTMWLSENCDAKFRAVCETDAIIRTTFAPEVKTRKTSGFSTTPSIPSTVKYVSSSSTSNSSPTTSATDAYILSKSTATDEATTADPIPSTVVPSTARNTTPIKWVTAAWDFLEPEHQSNAPWTEQKRVPHFPMKDQTTIFAENSYSNTDRVSPVTEDSGFPLYIIIAVAAGGGMILVILLVVTIAVCCRSKRKHRRKASEDLYCRPRPEFGSLHRRNNSPTDGLRAVSSLDSIDHRAYTLPTSFKNSLQVEETTFNSAQLPRRKSSRTYQELRKDVPLAASHSDDAFYGDSFRRMSRDTNASNDGLSPGLSPIERANAARAEYARQHSDDGNPDDNPAPLYIPIIR